MTSRKTTDKDERNLDKRFERGTWNNPRRTSLSNVWKRYILDSRNGFSFCCSHNHNHDCSRNRKGCLKSVSARLAACVRKNNNWFVEQRMEAVELPAWYIRNRNFLVGRHFTRCDENDAILPAEHSREQLLSCDILWRPLAIHRWIYAGKISADVAQRTDIEYTD